MCSDIKKNTRFLTWIKGSKGYTLIEAVVAVAIFSAMMMLAMAALNQGFKQYKAVMEEGVNFWKIARSYWLHKSVSGVVYYYVSDEKRLSWNTWRPYIVCRPDLLSYVSNTPMAGELPVVVWIVTEKNSAKDALNLMYYELPVYTKNMEDIKQEFISGAYKNGNSFSIVEDVTDVTMECYAMDSLTKLWSWVQKYETKPGVTILPSAVRINYRKHNKNESIFFNIRVNGTFHSDPNVI
ncbi:MAG: prepilin-type N-terminal cleavage/methylation domain-containing protein [Nitrospirae bacterium]|nr:prepilin-type N-terminal cleavage/methylation domain-containing protein [Nitrospirota bacterium]